MRSASFTARGALMATAAMTVALALPAASWAQAASRPARPAAPNAVEEVVVTAQLREESLQDVPISAIVLSGKVVAQQNINNLNTLTQALPSIHVGNTASAADLYIRGTGSGTNASFDQAVGTFIDGIYYGRSRISSAAFFDLDHIEILKGPQSTFFGNNAIAGAINMGTRAPSDTLTGTARALYGTHGNRVGEVAVGGPLSDTFSARAAVHYDGSDGWLKRDLPPNQFGKSHIPAQDNFGARLTLLYKPTQDLSLKFKADYSDNRNNGLGIQDTQCPPTPPFVVTGFCTTLLGLGLGNTVGLDKNTLTQNNNQAVHLQTQAQVLTVNYQVGGHTLTSITGHTHYNFDTNLDTDGTPLFLASASSAEYYDQVSQEFRIASPTGQAVEYLAGVYYQRDKVHSDQQQYLPYLTATLAPRPPFASLAPFLPLAVQRAFSQNEESYAAFGSISWHVTDDLTVTGGLRATHVRKSFNNIQAFGTATSQYNGFVLLPGTINPQNNGQVVSTGLQGVASSAGLGPAGTQQDSGSDHALLPSVKVQYQLQPEVMTYLSYSKGFLAGGFNGLESTGITTNAPYSPEYVNAFEGGVKGRFLDGRLVLNTALFYSKYRDFQVTQSIQQVGGVRSLVTNAASVITKGVEVDGVWQVTDDFRVSGNVAYNDAYYGSYKNVAQNSLGNFCRANLNNVICITTFGGNGDPGATRDLSGKVTPFAPKWSGSVLAAYGIHAGDLLITPSVTAVFSSSYFPSGSTLNDPVTQQGSYVRWDAQLTIIKPEDGRWAIDLIGKNLTDEDIITAALTWPNTPGGSLQAKQEPRNVAIQLRLNW